MQRASLLTVLVLCLCADAALADDLIVPTAQLRKLSCEAKADDLVTYLADSDEDEATDFGPFVSTVAASVSDPDAFSQAGAWQDSKILPSSIVTKGSHFSNSEAYGGLWLAEARARNELDVTFTVTAKASFTVAGSIEAFDNGLSSYGLVDGNGNSIVNEYSFGDGTVPISESGTLDPGTYRVIALSQGSTYAYPGDYDYAFGAYDVTLDLTPLSGTYCPVTPNSFGAGATIGFGGSQDIAANDFVLEVEGSVPNQFGVFFYGAAQTQTPLGDGSLCVGGTLYRLGPATKADMLGSASRPVDFNAPPAGGGGGGTITASSTWNFQWWFRDPMGPGGTGMNLSDALWVTFCP